MEQAKSKAKISLIIPAYNEEKYIGACIDHALKASAYAIAEAGKGKQQDQASVAGSAADQEAGFCEIIIIDNASTDGTRDVAERYPGVRVVHEASKGLVFARQRGYKESVGDILAYVDADAQMPEGWLARVRSEFSKNDNLSCLSGPYIYYDISPFQQFIVRLYWWILGMPVYWIVGFMVTGSNFALKRSVVDQMNGFDTSIKFYGEDTDIARRASKFGKVLFSSSFPMYTSGRRLKGQGLYYTGIIYIVNFLSEVLFHKPSTSEYRDIR